MGQPGTAHAVLNRRRHALSDHQLTSATAMPAAARQRCADPRRHLAAHDGRQRSRRSRSRGRAYRAWTILGRPRPKPTASMPANQGRPSEIMGAGKGRCQRRQKPRELRDGCPRRRRASLGNRQPDQPGHDVEAPPLNGRHAQQHPVRCRAMFHALHMADQAHRDRRRQENGPGDARGLERRDSKAPGQCRDAQRMAKERARVRAP